MNFILPFFPRPTAVIESAPSGGRHMASGPSRLNGATGAA